MNLIPVTLNPVTQSVESLKQSSKFETQMIYKNSFFSYQLWFRKHNSNFLTLDIIVSLFPTQIAKLHFQKVMVLIWVGKIVHWRYCTKNITSISNAPDHKPRQRRIGIVESRNSFWIFVAARGPARVFIGRISLA